MNTYTERFKKHLVEAAFSTCPHDGRNQLWDMGTYDERENRINNG